MSEFSSGEPPVNPEVDAASEHPIYGTQEMVERLYGAFDDRLGATINATRLYEGVYGRPYDSSNPLAVRSRIYLQLTLNQNHSFSKSFYALSKSEGRAVQIGAMYFLGSAEGDAAELHSSYMQVPNLNTVLLQRQPRRVYRMLPAEKYAPMLHVGKSIRENHLVEWQPAVVPDLFDLPERASTPRPAKNLKDRQDAKAKAETAKQPKKKRDVTSESEGSAKAESWKVSFVTAVRDAIAVKMEEGLMVEGDIPASNIRILANSPLIANDQKRDRLFKAGLIPRSKKDIKTSLTATDLIFSELINPKKDILGQKTPKQKAAIEIVRHEVVAHFEANS